MLKDLIPYVDAKYRVAPGRENRAMAGLSAGGAATYNVGLKHLELFSALRPVQRGRRRRRGLRDALPATGAGSEGDQREDQRLLDWVRHRGSARQPAKTLDAELTKLQINHTYAERAGGHVWPVWRWALAEFAPQLFQKR